MNSRREVVGRSKRWPALLLGAFLAAGAVAEETRGPSLTCLGEEVCAPAKAGTPPQARAAAERVLEEVYALPDEEKRHFLEARRDAVGFAIFPNVQRQGMFIGTMYGKGVLSYKDEFGDWSPPILLTIQGQSFGPQFGAQTSNIIFIFRTVCGLRDFLVGHHHMMPQADGVAIEHVGHEANPLDIQVHVFNRGGMFGQSTDVYTIHIDADANASLYGYDLQPGCIVETMRVGPRAPWMFRFFETLRLPPGQPHSTIELK
jgi:lipid-binding SYLF domain-containing protein